MVRMEFRKSGCLSFVVEEILVQQVPTLLNASSQSEMSPFSTLLNDITENNPTGGSRERLEIVQIGLTILEFASFLTTRKSNRDPSRR